MDLGLEDFKQLLLDLYLAQRENAELHEILAERDAAKSGELKSRDGGAIE